MNILKKSLAFTALFFGFMLALSPAIVFAQDSGGGTNPPTGGGTPASATTPANGSSANKDAVCEGVGLAGGSCDPAGGGTGVQGVIVTVINILSFMVGLVAVVMIIVGGFKYVTSGGDSNGVNNAKNTILYAVIGLVIAAMAQIMVQFVLGKVVKTTLPKCHAGQTQNCTP